MTNVPLEEQTKESLTAHIQSLEGICKTQDEAARKAQLELGRVHLAAKRSREALSKIQTVTESNYDDADAKKLLLEIKEIVVKAQAGPE